LFLGTGIDGNRTFDGVSAVTGAVLEPLNRTYTLNQSLMLHTAVIAANVTVNVNGYRLWCRHTLWLQGVLRSTVLTPAPAAPVDPVLFRYPFVALRGAWHANTSSWLVAPPHHSIHVFADTVAGAGQTLAPGGVYLYARNVSTALVWPVNMTWFVV
jgi:hypothetical protein